MEPIKYDEDRGCASTPPVLSTSSETPALSPTLRDALAHARFFCAQGTTASTQRAYAADFSLFSEWCHQEGLCALPAPPEVVVLYLSALAMSGKKVSTLTRRAVAIKHAHTLAGYPSPTETEAVHTVLAGIRRTLGVAAHGVDALTPQEIRDMVDALPQTPIGLRDRAILLLGYAGAFRRSEVVGLNVDDLYWHPEGLRVHLRRSKTDAEGKGRWVGIPYGRQTAYCPVHAVEVWLHSSGITTGAIFRGMNKSGRIISERLTGRAVATLIKRAAQAIGIEAERVSGHTLRVSHVTAAARAGVPERVIQWQTGHRSVEMVRRYCRQGTLFIENSATALGL